MKENLPCQIYLLTPPRIDDVSAFAKTLEQVLKAALVASLQIRLKDVARETIVETTKILMPIAHAHGTAVIINDDPTIAAESGADGVHLGQWDMMTKGGDIKSAKDMLERDAILGVTCHNSKDLAFKAGSGGADYVAFGSFFESKTKPDARSADLELLTWWHDIMEIPSVAIGGITVDNAKAVIAAGADFIAVSAGVWDYADGPESGSVQAVKRLSELCVRYSRPIPV